MPDVRHILTAAAEAKVAADPALVKALLAGGAGVLGGGMLSAKLTHDHDEIARQHTRNTAFGAGLATGIAGPRIMDVLQGVAQRGAS